MTRLIIKSVCFLIYFLLPNVTDGQNKTHTDWVNSPFEHFSFIENKGQFDNVIAEKNSNIYYGAISTGTEIYITQKGITYKCFNSKRPEKKENERKESQLATSEANFIEIAWVGSNPLAKIEGNDIQSSYCTYSDQKNNTIKANTYKKITCRNLYPDIDVEYIIPKKGGLKYTIILHPGADMSMIKMKYKNVRNVSADRQGNIIIKSEFGEFIDHAPLSFYASDNSKINSSFKLNGDEVTFKTDDYDNTKTIIIDPWISSPGAQANIALDINYDLAGNVYVYGAPVFNNSNYCLEKFNSAGVLQWSYYHNFYGGGSAGTLYGDFALDEITGTSYIGEGGLLTRIHKVNSAGSLIGFYSGNGIIDISQVNEFWRMEYSSCLNKIVIGCGSTKGPYQLAMLDPNMTSVTPVNSFATTFSNQDVSLLTLDPQGSFCYVNLAKNEVPSLVNTILKCPLPALAPSSFSVTSGHNFVELGVGQLNNRPRGNGYNGMACGQFYLYSYDGIILKKWNKLTGAFIAQVNTGGTEFESGGLTVDACDNVYAGVGNTIKYYRSSLSLITSYATSNTTLDLKLGPNNKLYACGIGFVREISVGNSGKIISTSSTPATSCNGCNGTATVNINCGGGNLPDYNYLWTPGGQTGKIATGLCPGTYTIVATTACSLRDTAVVVVLNSSNSSLTTTISKINPATCNGNGSSTVTPSGGVAPYTYLWSNGQTAQTATNLNAGSYSITTSDANGCSTINTITIQQPTIIVPVINSTQITCNNNNGGATIISVTSGTTPYTFSWSGGQTTQTITGLSTGNYTVTVTDANGCRGIQNTMIYPFIPVSLNLVLTDGTCGNPGQVAIHTLFGIAPLTYSLSNGSTINNSGTGYKYAAIFSTGTYTLTVTDGNGCIVTKSFTVTVPPNPAIASFNISPNDTICINTVVDFTHTGTTGTYFWNILQSVTPIASGSTINFSYSFLTAGTYSIQHTTTTGGCSSSITYPLEVLNCSGPAVTATGSSVCPGICATVTSSGAGGAIPYTYSWSTGATSQNINPCPASTTSYTVTIMDSGGSTSTSTAIVIVNPAIIVTATATNITCNGSTNGSILANPTGGTSPFAYSWGNGQTSQSITGLASGNYSVTVVDSKGCTATSTSAVVSPPPLLGQFNKGTAGCNGCGCQEWIMATATGGTGPYTYTWADGYVNRYKNSLCPGVYVINIKDKNGCIINLSLIAP